MSNLLTVGAVLKHQRKEKRRMAREMALVDDGTMGTVFVCSECEQWVRTNPEPPDKDFWGYHDWDRVCAGREIALAWHECTGWSQDLRKEKG